jgi:hypothetical protein
MIRDVKVFLFLVVVVISLLVIKQTTESNLYANAHLFSSDQSAEFQSLIHQINVEISLINNTFPSEVNSSYHHAKNAAELINMTYHLANAISSKDFQIIYEEEQLNNYNSTIQALVVASITDEILRKYGDAYNIDYDLTDMSNMAMTNLASMSEDGKEVHSYSLGNNDNELVLANIADYQSALALSRVAIKIFEGKLRPLFQVDNHNSNSSITSVSKIENGLVELNNSLKNKATPHDLMKIVHTQIHPSLQLGYNLESRIRG